MRKAKLSLEQEFDLLECKCGQKFMLFNIWVDEEGNTTTILPQERCCFCPYCGKEWMP